jgi:hypothetical protein
MRRGALESRPRRPDLSDMHATPDPRPVPPERPLPADCCDGGCAVCVFDSYEEELEHYRAQLAAWLARHPDARA